MTFVPGPPLRRTIALLAVAAALPPLSAAGLASAAAPDVRLGRNIRAGRPDSHIKIMATCERAAAQKVLG
jgi:hypothetical protein